MNGWAILLTLICIIGLLTGLTWIIDTFLKPIDDCARFQDENEDSDNPWLI
jgi:hypothetical protein